MMMLQAYKLRCMYNALASDAYRATADRLGPSQPHTLIAASSPCSYRHADSSISNNCKDAVYELRQSPCASRQAAAAAESRCADHHISVRKFANRCASGSAFFVSFSQSPDQSLNLDRLYSHRQNSRRRDIVLISIIQHGPKK